MPTDSVHNMVITVLTTDRGKWEEGQRGKLATNLRLLVGISGDPRFPDILMLKGQWTKDHIATVLGFDAFKLETVKGLFNPKLPWRPPF